MKYISSIIFHETRLPDKALFHKKGRNSMMDIASLSTALSAVTTNNDVGVAMLSKQLDMTEDMGDSMVKAMELSVTPAIGGNFDVSV